MNNFFIIVDGYTAVTSKLHRIYFVLFWIIMVNCLFNVVVAVILESFISEWDQDDAASENDDKSDKAFLGDDDDDDDDHKDDQSRARQATTPRDPRRNTDVVALDAARITGTMTGLPHGTYAVALDATADLTDDQLDGARRRSLLRHLLTPTTRGPVP